MKFTVYFLGFNVPDYVLNMGDKERSEYAFSREGLIELTQ